MKIGNTSKGTRDDTSLAAKAESNLLTLKFVLRCEESCAADCKRDGYCDSQRTIKAIRLFTLGSVMDHARSSLSIA